MARFARIDSRIRANRLILANRSRVPELNPFFANRASGGLKRANRRFEAIRANRSHTVKNRVSSANRFARITRFARIESPCHLRIGELKLWRPTLSGPKCQLRPEGRNRRGETQLRGPERFWGSRKGPRNSTPRFSNSGSRKPERAQRSTKFNLDRNFQSRSKF